MNDLAILQPRLDRLQRNAILVGTIGLAVCVAAAFGNPQQFFQSYLEAYLFWIGISLGCLAIVMVHHLVGGAWGLPVRRLLEAGSRTLPLMAALFAPFLVGTRVLYVWARPQHVAADPLLQQKALYLNVPGFWIRAIVYFAIWITMTYFLNKWSLTQDETADPSLTGRIKALSGPGLVLYGLTVTFSAIDWVMSLEPEWHSTMYGMIFMAAQGLEALAFVIIVSYLLARTGPLAKVALTPRFHDLGNLTLTFVMLWMYTAFSQFLIIWAENLTDEIPWYLRRSTGGWQDIAIALIVLQFALPFVLLLSRVIKRSSQLLSLVAGLILAMQLVSVFWLVAPAFHPGVFRIHWMDVVAPIGLGGIWLAMFLRQVKNRSLVPRHDPRFVKLLEGLEGK
jgi:hypothetical protein